MFALERVITCAQYNNNNNNTHYTAGNTTCQWKHIKYEEIELQYAATSEKMCFCHVMKTSMACCFARSLDYSYLIILHSWITALLVYNQRKIR